MKEGMQIYNITKYRKYKENHELHLAREGWKDYSYLSFDKGEVEDSEDRILSFDSYVSHTKHPMIEDESMVEYLSMLEDQLNDEEVA